MTILSLMNVGLKINSGVKKVLGDKSFTNEVDYHICQEAEFGL